MNFTITPSPLQHYTSPQQYKDFYRELNCLKNEREQIGIMRQLCRTDLFFLLYFICNKKFMEHPWLFARCKEIEKEPNGYLDLWSRGHCKSTIITYGKTIQDILASHGDNPLPEWKEITGGSEPAFMIFSATLDLAKDHLFKIKREFEANSVLKYLFPDIIWENPFKSGIQWNLSSITLKQKLSNYPTLEAFGLSLDLPVGKRCNVMILDDCVRESNVSTPEQIQKTRTNWDSAQNYFMKGLPQIRRHAGTFYHWNDLYCQLIEAGSVKARKYPATENGQLDGKLVYMKEEEWQNNIRDLSRYNIGCQYLLNPTVDSVQGFKIEWLRYAEYNFDSEMTGNIYIMVDPAGSKEKTSDYTVMWVIAAGADGNYYVIDLIRDRLSLVERGQKLFELVRKYRPIAVGYEQVGMQADIEHIKYLMSQFNYHFKILSLKAVIDKKKRIGRLEPDFRNGRIFLPRDINYITLEGKYQNLVDVFIKEEYLQYPACSHDDMLDALSRIKDEDMCIQFPRLEEDDFTQEFYSNRKVNSSAGY